MQRPERKLKDPGAWDDSPVYLTAEGLQRLRERLARLKKAVPEMANEARRTAAYGDRSENDEYKEAKALLRRTHRQILSIEDQLKRVVVIASGRNAAGTVQIGSVVVLEVLGSKNSAQGGQGTQKKFHIVGPSETNPERGRISQQSPLGAALLSRKQGDLVGVQTEHGVQEYRILSVE